MAGSILEGVFAINKPPAVSSAQVIRDVQSHFNPSKLFRPWLDREQAHIRSRSHNQQKKRAWKGRKFTDVKIGHGGTLDPMATGVLILGVGAGTKELGHFSTECTKSYETVMLFGAATDTYDTQGKIVGRKPYSHITENVVEEALAQFRGKGVQTPPIFSAIRVHGKRLYEYAREGKPLPDGFKIEERPVDVSELELVEWYPGGTHKWHWPDHEADSSEKKLAEQALHFNSEVTGTAGTMDDSSKRKRDGDAEEATGSGAAKPWPKRAKADAEMASSTAGSGALTATIERLSTAPGAQPESEGAPPPKDDAQPSPSREPPPTKPESSGGEKTKHSQPSHPTRSSPCPAPAVRLRMTVTSGFYVRSLCHDLGAAVGSLATMAQLSRTRQSNFDLDGNVLQYEDLEKGEECWGPKVQKLLEEWQERKAKSRE